MCSSIQAAVGWERLWLACRAGVRRISLGGSLYQSQIALAKERIRRLLSGGEL